MAVWQFNVAFIPQSWIDSGGDVASLFEEEEGFDPALAWRHYDNAQLEQVLSRVLSKGKSWHSDLTLWATWRQMTFSCGEVKDAWHPFRCASISGSRIWLSFKKSLALPGSWGLPSSC